MAILGAASILQMSIVEAHSALTSGAVTAVQLTQASLDRIELVEPTLNSFITVTPEEALQQAVTADIRLARGLEVTPLTGIPIAIKDNIATAGIRTTAGSRALSHRVPEYDALTVARLRAAGAIILGKTNMDAWAMGSWGLNSGFGPTFNPVDTDRLPGGSSSGSAAAVAGHLAFAALGSDTGGSVRQPAAICGIVGLRPTLHGINPAGLMPSIPSCDTIGPMARTVPDTRILFEVLSGKSTTDAPIRFPTALRFAIPRDLEQMRWEEGIGRNFGKMIDLLRDSGAILISMDLPDLAITQMSYHALAAVGAAQSIAEYYGLEGNFGSRLQASLRTGELGPEVVARCNLGLQYLFGNKRAQYEAALSIRQSVERSYVQLLNMNVDVIMTPTSPLLAPLAHHVTDAPPLPPWDRLTIPAALAGLPALSMPSGLSPEGLPIGLQLIGRANGEFDLLAIAAGLELLLKSA